MKDTAISRVLLIHPSGATRRALGRQLREVAGMPVTLHEAGSPTEGLQAARWLDPRLVLIDLSEDRALAFEVARELRRSDRLLIGLYNPLLLKGREDDFFRSAARAGVNDFVPLPVSESELGAALAALPERGEAAGRGRVISFFGHHGGAGTSTLAVNTALLLAGSGEVGEVALCDTALQFGDVAALLGLAPDRDLADMARDLDDMGAVSAYLARQPDTGLRVLARPAELRDAEAITPADLSRLLIHLQRRFDYLVIDTPPVVDLITLAVLDLSNTVFLVTEAASPALIATARLLGLLEEQGLAAERLRLVLGRYSAFEGNLTPGAVAERLGRPVDYVVPYDRELVTAATRGAPPILGRQRGEFAQVVSQIADDVARPVGERVVAGEA